MRLTPNKNVETYAMQSKVAKLGLIAELPNFIASFVVCFLSNTLIVWMDFFNSFQSTLHYGIVFMVSRKFSGDLSDKYNYGVERVEVFTSFICDILIIVGLMMMAVCSVINIIDPSAPSDNLLLFLILKVINIASDIYFVIQQRYLSRKRKSKLTETEVTSSIRYLIEDVVMLVVALVCFIFRDFQTAWYFSPVMCLILSVVLFVQCAKHLKSSFAELTDRALPIHIQDDITDILLETHDIKHIYEVNCREMNSIVYVDLNVGFSDDTSYKQELEILDSVSERINTKFSNSNVSFVIRPINGRS